MIGFSVLKMLARYFAILTSILVITTSTPSVAKVQISNGKAFDRISFEFPKPVKFSSQKFGSQILIEFESAVPSAAGMNEKKVGKYIKTYLLQEKGREAVVTLKGKFRYKLYRVANKIVLDVGPGTDRKSKSPKGKNKKISLSLIHI